MISTQRFNGGIKRRLAVLSIAVGCVGGVCAPTASALNPQPLPPGIKAIGTHPLPPDPCNVTTAASRC
jgi:hypothetical protein